jgi:DNA gyrase subunit A
MSELPDILDGLRTVERDVLVHVPAGRRRTCLRILRAALGPSALELDELEIFATPDAPADRRRAIASYLALVHLAQDFHVRYPLVEGHGNFGSLSGDPPGAPRFTECRLSPFGEAVAAGWFPHGLVNGRPPHLLGHHARGVAAALELAVADPEATDDQILDALGPPELATGGALVDADAVRDVMRTGRGTLRVRSRVEVADRALVVLDLAWGANKSDVLTELRSGELAGVAAVDEAHPDRPFDIVIELLRGHDPVRVLANLFERTQLERAIPVDLRVDDNGVERPITSAELVRVFARSRPVRSGELLQLTKPDPRRTWCHPWLR